MPGPPAQPATGAGYGYDHTTAPDWRPLEQLARVCRDNPELARLDPDDFMYMGRAAHPTRPPILHYKHILTRRYLYLDGAGHAYAPRRNPPGMPGATRRSVISARRSRGSWAASPPHQPRSSVPTGAVTPPRRRP